MAKIRVYNLAHELDMDSKEVIEILNDLGIEVSSHMSTITDETAELVKGMYAGDNTAAENEEAHQEAVKAEAESKAEEENAAVKSAVEAASNSEAEAEADSVEIEIPITVKEFAEEIGEAPNNLIVELMNMGVMANVIRVWTKIPWNYWLKSWG